MLNFVFVLSLGFFGDSLIWKRLLRMKKWFIIATVTRRPIKNRFIIIIMLSVIKNIILRKIKPTIWSILMYFAWWKILSSFWSLLIYFTLRNNVNLQTLNNWKTLVFIIYICFLLRSFNFSNTLLRSNIYIRLKLIYRVYNISVIISVFWIIKLLSYWRLLYLIILCINLFL